MGGGNGAKSQQSRERNAKAAAGKGGKSQTESNAKAQSIQCKACFATFQSTSKAPTLQEHINGKHPAKSFAECFPNFVTA